MARLEIWLLTLVPSVPLLCIFLAFKTVLKTKQFEMQMLLMRGQSLTEYVSAYGSRRHRETKKPEDAAREIVKNIFWLHYSGWEYGCAIFFNVLVTSAVTALALALTGTEMGIPAPFAGLLRDSPAIINIVAGGIGALFWSVYEFSERYRSGDLLPDSIFRMGTRMLIVCAVGAIVGTIVKESLAWPIAFGVGVLPIATVRSFFIDRTSKALNLAPSEATTEDPSFKHLQGWNTDVRDKLLRSGVSSVEQLACTNPFQIFLRSNLDWRVILDLCDQALLVVYIEEKAESLRPLGYRSAGELAELDWYKDDTEFFSSFTYEEAVARIAFTLQTEVLEVKMLIRTLSEDVTVKLISTLWSDDTPLGEDDEWAALVTRTKEIFGVTLEEADVDQIQTVGALYEHICKLLEVTPITNPDKLTELNFITSHNVLPRKVPTPENIWIMLIVGISGELRVEPNKVRYDNKLSE